MLALLDSQKHNYAKQDEPKDSKGEAEGEMR